MVFPSEVLPAAVNAITSSPGRQRPIVMVTSDADGRPRVCVPDWGDLRVLDDRRLRVAIWPSDPTALNLDRDAPVLLIVTALSEVYLVDATARRLEGAAMVWAHYELTITSARAAGRGTVPYLPSDAGVELLGQGPDDADDTFRARVTAFRARRKAPRRSPWAPSSEGGKGEHRCTGGARP
ncbi:hypothetical protein ACFQZM_25255 [Actinomadura fibrosa]|uniref:Pyridoxamine 5'-phosphate oxidase putative domain-containing protein n=2 Tax=Actinomadura fibrosa TaxID=111802 RepID=A0ABW2XMX6_9ACTN|nr:hypothetical protein [Actinomadura fibrosa]